VTHEKDQKKDSFVSPNGHLGRFSTLQHQYKNITRLLSDNNIQKHIFSIQAYIFLQYIALDDFYCNRN